MSDKNERENINAENLNSGVDDYIRTASDDELGLNMFKETHKAKKNNIPGINNNHIKKAGTLSNSNKNNKMKPQPLSREQLQRRARNKMIVVSVIIFVLIISIGLSVFFGILSNKKDSLSVSFRYSNENKELGEVEYKIKNAKNYAYGVYYPFFDNVVLDKKISGQNSSIISSFLSKYRHYSPTKKGTGAVLFSDYSSTNYQDYILIVRTSEYRIPEEDTTYHISTIFYDTKNKKIMSAGDVFDSTFRDIISVKIKKYLKENTKYSDEQIENITNSQNLNTDNFSFDKNYFYFYINDVNGNTLTIKFDSNLIKSHMKMDFDEIIKKYDEMHTDISEKTSDETVYYD